LFYYIHIIEIPTDKGDNSYNIKISKIWNKQQQFHLNSLGCEKPTSVCE